MVIKKTMMIGDGLAHSVVVVMKRLGITRPTLMCLVGDKKIGHYKIGSRYWFTDEQIKRYQECNRVDAE